ncbi:MULTISPECIES: DUF6443 domain-containing protein [unclassified Sphingobacterium]|uniref:DUF6443 domain-containing protein n=1 Tax=unclassified Sphingobacterium TaxID=2609468 RepID=UPI0025ED8186|nr:MULTISPECIES: DUF6443 domain-containing protein [unclassified Sphingobacterium]
MKRQFLSAISTLLTLSTLSTLFTLSTAEAQSTDLTLDSYKGQGQIRAKGSVTLKPGFHIPSGSTVRIYTSSSLQQHPALQTQPSSNQNYILTRTFRKAGVTLANLSESRTVEEENQSIQYFDGLGRLTQTVQVMASPSHKDIVQYVEYDDFGRELKKYLPYAASGNVNGNYKSAAGIEVQNYYSPSQGWDADVKKTTVPFSETLFENSPLSRVRAQGAPGEAWQINNGHVVRTDYGTNTESEVRLWTLNTNGDGATSGYYMPGRLYKTIIKDENWTSGKAGTVEEFKDFEERTVLKRMWNINEQTQQEYPLNIYYVYDYLGNLRYVLPPAVTSGSFTEASSDFSNYIYGYKYDELQRIIEKHIPGKGKEEFVYNNNDQVVLSRDANRRAAGEWLFTKYDAFGRIILSGIYSSTENAAALSNQVNSNGQSVGRLWEIPASSDEGYTNDIFPKNMISYQLIHYYDRYDFPGNVFGNPTGNQASFGQVKTLLTGTKVRTIGTQEMLLTVNYYDLKGQVVQSKSQNHIGGTDIVDNTYSFVGELESSVRKHIVNSQTTSIATTNEYDHTGRLSFMKQRINNQDEVTLLTNSYNEIGQLKTKAVGADMSGNNPVNTTAYHYNERGWLTSSRSDYFSQQLSYQATAKGAIPQWNGNISEQQWGQNLSVNEYFVYSYDQLNRLKEGSSPSAMKERMEYDNMGNILKLTRNDSPIHYSYTGNKLNLVSGLVTGGYSYDANGNVTMDRNNMQYTYNYLNLPLQVMQGTKTVTYQYNAMGGKLRRSSGESGQRDYIVGIEYQNGVIHLIHTGEGVAMRKTDGTYSYRYNLADHLGNVRATVYRNPANNNVEVLQRDDYFPFGLQKSSPVSGNNKYLYNGKEKQEELDGQLDYGARFYDPVIARWKVVDKLSEVYREVSPYSYALANPLKFIDKDGNFIVDKDGKIIATPKLDQNGRQIIRTATHSGAQYMAFTIKTNKGTEVEVWKLASENKADRTPPPGYEVDLSTNCYGFVLTDGEFYMPIYDVYDNADGVTTSTVNGNQENASLFLRRILEEEGIMIDYATDGSHITARNAQDGVYMEGYHIFRKKNNSWQAKHGYWGPVYDKPVSEALSFEGAATTRDFSSFAKGEFYPYKDNRPIKNYTGVNYNVNINGVNYNNLNLDELLRIINGFLKNQP